MRQSDAPHERMKPQGQRKSMHQRVPKQIVPVQVADFMRENRRQFVASLVAALRLGQQDQRTKRGDEARRGHFGCLDDGKPARHA
jgi:hypothetical protein